MGEPTLSSYHLWQGHKTLRRVFTWPPPTLEEEKDSRQPEIVMTQEDLVAQCHPMDVCDHSWRSELPQLTPSPRGQPFAPSVFFYHWNF